MKKCFFMYCICFGVFALQAQDQLFKRDNTKLLVKVLEIDIEEIRYKLFDSLKGETYSLKKSEVSIIIFENGRFEVFKENESKSKAAPPQKKAPKTSVDKKKDSLTFYTDSRSISVNLLSFANLELGLIFQKEFYKKNFNVVIPASFGLGKAYMAERTYYNTTGTISLNRKIFEIGAGINYLAVRKGFSHYYIGPVFKFMKYDVTQTYSYDPIPQVSQALCLNCNSPWVTISQDGYLYCFTGGITNGLSLKFRKMYILNLFCSLGYKYNMMSEKLMFPGTNTAVEPFKNPFQFYMWLGLALGVTF